MKFRFFVVIVAMFMVLVPTKDAVAAGTYVENNKNDTVKLMQMKQYYDAAVQCMSSGSFKTNSISLSGTRSDFNNEYMKNVYNLNGTQMFDDNAGDNRVWGNLFEAWAGTRDANGRIRCNEMNIIPDLLDMVGQYNKEVVDSIVCNGDKAGIYSVRTGYGPQLFGSQYDANKDGEMDWPQGWSTNQDDCSGNLAKLREFVETRPNETILGSGNGNTNYGFSVKLTPNKEGATAHLKSVLDQYVGDFGSLDNTTRNAMDYWLYYETFNLSCGSIQSGTTTAPSEATTNMNAMYDAKTDTTYYLADSQINQGEKVYLGPDEGNNMTCKELAAKLAPDKEPSLAAAELMNEETGQSADETENDTQKNDGGVDGCDNAAGVFSWIVCPLTNMLSEAVKGLFGFIEAMLVVDPGILDTGGKEGSATFSAWGTFRDISNVVLVVLFIMIIVSQVTGFGIDNYGIKRMLPRLIVVGVLINLSYIVCQLLVDLSNIVGSNIYRLLETLSDGLNIVATDGQGGTLIAAIVLVIGVLVAAIAISGGVVLLPLLLSLIGALVSTIFMFLLLGVRQAAVAIFVIIAPLAFAMNILPNTQNLFKKWLNIFKVLLLLYPICSLVMGGGLYGCVLLLSLSEAHGVDGLLGIIFTLVAFILLIAPVFFIPKLTKGAFDGLGKIGATMSGLGGRFSGFARGKTEKGLQGTGVYKNAQDRVEARKVNREYKRTARRDASVIRRYGARGEAGALSAKKERKLAEAKRAQIKRENDERSIRTAAGNPDFMEAERNKAEVQARRDEGNMSRMAGAGYVASATAGIEDAEMIQAVKDEEALMSGDATTANLQNQLQAALSTGDEVKIRASQNMLSRKGEAGRDAVRRAMIDAEAAGNVSEGAKRVYGQNIMDHHAADYKNNARSTFNYANEMAENAGVSGMTMAGATSSVSSVKPETLATMDDSELSRLDTDANHAELSKLAYGALQNPNLTSMKLDRRQELERIAKDYSPPSASEGPTLNVQNGGTGPNAENGSTEGGSSQPPQPRPLDGSGGIPRAGAENLNEQSGNVRGNVVGENGGRIITSGPDAGLEQTDSGIIIGRE